MEGYSNNNACIMAYLDLFQALSGGADGGQQWQEILAREQATPPGVVLASRILRQTFSLSEQEFLLCMAAMALEMDGGLRNEFRRRYGLHLPTLEYGLQLLDPLCPMDGEALAGLYGENPLCRLLLQIPAQPPAVLLEYPLLLDKQVFGFLTGLSAADTPGARLLRAPERGLLSLWPAQKERLLEWYQAGTERPLCLCGPEGSGRRSLVLECLGGCVWGDLARLAGLSLLEQRQALREMTVLARLAGEPLCAGADPGGSLPKELAALCRRWGVGLILAAEDDEDLPQPCEILRLPRELDPETRRKAWQAFAPDAGPDTVPAGEMTAGGLQETAGLARRHACRAGRRTITREDVQEALRQRSGALAFGIRYDVADTLEDMVLPKAVRDQLERICQAARWSDQLAQWGLPRQRGGVTAVFHGPSGTGKTMAAGAVAHALGLPLLRADLSRLMDKYVGETEKHLARLLQCARENQCVLLFDEADALFGKRSGVSTGQDKYANLSTSFLLQEIEGYRGVALLSTNLLSNFDDAFLRRLQYMVRFPMPDAALREKLWRRALPPERQAGDIPFGALAAAELSPARIHAAVRSAAVAALAHGRQQVDSRDLVQALGLELEKSGKSLPRGLEALLPAQEKHL